MCGRVMRPVPGSALSTKIRAIIVPVQMVGYSILKLSKAAVKGELT